MALQNLFRCAYSAVDLRMSEVMLRRPLLLALYERKGQHDPAHWPAPTKLGDPQVMVWRRTAGMESPRSRLLNGRQGGAPRKGKALSAGSRAERAARSGRPEYDEGDGIAVAARPVPWEHRWALKPQLGEQARRYSRTQPRVVPKLTTGS